MRVPDTSSRGSENRASKINLSQIGFVESQIARCVGRKGKIVRKKSGKHSAELFLTELERLRCYIKEIDGAGLSDQAATWAYEAALLKSMVAFERLMLECLVAAINNDTGTISSAANVIFPRHLTDEVCEYLVVGGGYFDFRGRDGLIKELKKYVPDGHWLLAVVKKSDKKALDRLVALRNWAAHESAQSKRVALRAINAQRAGSAGSWLKKQGRLDGLLHNLEVIGRDVARGAPF